MNAGCEAELVARAEGEDYERVVDAANALGGSTQAVTEHLLARGQDDGSASVRTIAAELEESRHQLHEVENDGARYWLQVDHHERVYALYRRVSAAEPGTSARPKEQNAP